MVDLKMILTIRLIFNNSVHVNIIFILKLSHLKCVIVRWTCRRAGEREREKEQKREREKGDIVFERQLITAERLT